MRRVPADLAGLEETDLAKVDVREGVADERVETGLVDLHVEDRAAARRNEDCLDALLWRVGDVGVHPRAVEDRADDVEVGVERRSCGAVPLVAYLVPLPDDWRYPTAIGLTRGTLFAFGAARTLVPGSAG